MGDTYDTEDRTCVRDYIHVTDLVEAHIMALDKAEEGKVDIYNVGTGKGRSCTPILCFLICLQCLTQC
jgi:UDP-arabinose 4-epimerase